MIARVGSVAVRMVALGVTAFVTCNSAGAAEAKGLHIGVGSNDAPLILTVRVEDYRAAPLDLLTPAASGDSLMTRFLKTYNEAGRAGDTKRFASLFEPEVAADPADHAEAVRELKEQFLAVRSVRLLAVLYWGDLQFGVVEQEIPLEQGGTRRWAWPHPARCVGDTCRIIGSFEIGRLGRVFAEAFVNKGSVQFAAPAQGETLLPILPAASDFGHESGTTDPIVLHLIHASDSTTQAVTAAIAPSTVSRVYSLGPDVCVAVLKSDKDRAVHLLPLQRTGKSWTKISEPSSLDAWRVLSSASTNRVLQTL